MAQGAALIPSIRDAVVEILRVSNASADVVETAAQMLVADVRFNRWFATGKEALSEDAIMEILAGYDRCRQRCAIAVQRYQGDVLGGPNATIDDVQSANALLRVELRAIIESLAAMTPER